MVNSLDENEAYRSSIVEFMRNKINNIKLAIPLPVNASELESTLGVTEIDIIWKESDALAVKVLDSIPSITFSSTTNNVYTYDYQSRKPYKTLPESEIIRVYDKIPVRALGQEVISNRIVYSNFQDKHTPPATINYDVAVTDKSAFSISNSNSSLFTTSQVEYPEHTLKLQYCPQLTLNLKQLWLMELQYLLVVLRIIIHISQILAQEIMMCTLGLVIL